MSHLNYLLHQGLTVDRHSDKIKVGPANKIDWIIKEYLVENKPAILHDVDQRDHGLLGEGLGTAISNRIPSLFKTSTCGCSDKILRLNKAGYHWGLNHQDEIIQMLVAATRKHPLTKYIASLTRPFIEHIVDASLQEEQTCNQERLATQFKNDWFVGITTAPRSNPTLMDCIYSIRETGWEPTIFAEPGSLATDCATVWNEDKLGVWRNWVSMVRYGLSTEAKYFVLFQDDIILHPNTKGYVESLPNIEFLGLYTSRKYGYKRPPGIHRIRTRSLWGVCAVVYSRELLQKIVNHPLIEKWKGAPPRRNKEQFYRKRTKDPSLIANSDTAIGKIMNRLKRPMYFVNPSPARHIATVSSINHGGNGRFRNCNPCANYHLSLKRQCVKVDFNTAFYVRDTRKKYKDLGQTITTSLAFNRIEHQQRCIRGWQDLGLKVISLQLKGEADKLRSNFPGVEFIEVERRHHKYPRTMITDHDAISTSLGKPTILCNADIEILYTQKDFIKHWIEVPDKTLQIGIRWNYDEGYSNIMQEPWGMDAFRLLPQETLPELGFSLGNCVWDYWVPYHYLHQGYQIRTDFDPGMFHLRHPSSWTKQDHIENMKTVCEHYSIEEPQIRDWMKAKKDTSGVRIPRDSPNQRVFFNHIPKTGGKSVIASLKERVETANEWVYEDWIDSDFHYGHNLPAGPGLNITIVREPIERLISLYTHILERKNHPLHQKAKQISLIELAKSEQEFQNDMTRQLDDPSKYDLIGFTHQIPEFLGKLTDMLQLEIPLKVYHLNNTISPRILSREERKILTELNQKDIALYNEIKKRWQN